MIDFYGEIVDSASHPRPTATQMGTGFYAAAGWPYAAFQRLLKYQVDASGTLLDYDGAPFVTDPREYDLERHMNIRFDNVNERIDRLYSGPAAASR